MTNHLSEIYLAGGCFWGTEHFLQQIYGVITTTVGYANGFTKEPSYQEVCTQKTGHTETVKTCYDPALIDLSLLLKLFFKSIDPSSLNQQGEDKGTQYRSGIYYTDSKNLPIIQQAITQLTYEIDKPVVVEVLPLENFYPAEEYHQCYLNKNSQGYCHINPALFEMAKTANTPQKTNSNTHSKELKNLTAIQYEVTQNATTEPPFKNEYWQEFRKGIYVDIISGDPLFISTDKFESGCGWPSFSKPIDPSIIKEATDITYGRQRTEIRNQKNNSHLGHVFNDGPKELGGLRYCINSSSLRFIPKEEMQEKGYAKYLKLLD